MTRRAFLLTLVSVVPVASGSFLAVGAHAQTVETADYVFPNLNTPTGEPDPGVWSSSGNLTPRVINWAGTADLRPRHVSSLLYFHTSYRRSKAPPGMAAGAAVTARDSRSREPRG